MSEIRKAGDALKEDTPEAAEAAETVATGSVPESGNLDKYIDYLNSYDRKARGAGSSKGTDRFSGLDVRHVYDARKDFGIDKYDAADQVLQYARRIEDESRMGGATEDALNKLRGILGDRPKGSTTPETPTETPTETETETPSDDTDSGQTPIGDITNNPQIGSGNDGGSSVMADELLHAFIKNSFNAQGGTLTNTGNITSEGDVKLDNSVTNSNTINGFRSDGYRLNLGDLKL